MAKNKETEERKEEREYVIPLRKQVNKVPRYKKTNKAIRTIKEFVARHMKVPERDLRKVKLDRYLNEAVWMRGIRNPPSKIRVKVVRDEENVRVELAELPGKIKFKKERIERREKKAEESGKKKKTEKETARQTSEEKAESAEKKKEESEKKSAVVEAGKAMEKAAAKQSKHQTKKNKQPQRQVRVALKK